jgi:HlyD family secretion protein
MFARITAFDAALLGKSRILVRWYGICNMRASTHISGLFMDQAINPEIINRRRWRTSLAFGAGLIALCSAAWGINRVVRPSIAVSDVHIVEVRHGNISNTINASGVVIPTHEEVVASPIQTRIAKVLAKPGQRVAAGELLLELDDRTVRLAADDLQEQLAQQENHITSLTLELAQKNKQLVSNIELLELDLQAAKAKWERYQPLRVSGVISGDNYLQAELSVKRAEIQLRQQRELIDDNRRATVAAIEGAKLQKNILQKQLEQQQHLLAQSQVRAPFAGMLTSLLAEEGSSVTIGQQVAKVSELSNFRVEASLSDFHARSLNVGQPVQVEQGGVVLTGHVHMILPEIQNGTVKLLVELDQPNHPLLRDKLRVDVNIVTENKADTLVADAGAAFNGRGPQTVFVVKDGVARKTVLDIGSSDGKSVEILAGAKAGDHLIVSDIKRYQDTDSIRISQ